MYLLRDDTEDAVEDGYELAFMETDGVFSDLKNIQFNYEYKHLEAPLVSPANMYDRSGRYLKPGIALKFNTLSECVQVIGGMTYAFFQTEDS